MSKERILHVVTSNPKSYHRVIAKTPELLAWVKANTLVNSTRLVEEIYSAVHRVSNICPNGNTKTLDRWSTGFKCCGPANRCKCAKESIANNVSATKQSSSEAQKEATNTKRKTTMLQRYGAEYNLQRIDVKQVLCSPKISESAHAKLTDYEWLYTEYVEKKRSLVDIADELNVYYGTVTEYCRKFDFEIRQTSNYSLVEREVSQWVESLGVHCITNDRSTLRTHELDILIPSHNLAIEVNGLYWHSHDPRSSDIENKHRHLNKLNLATAAGLRLIQITDYEWKHKQSAVKSIIKHALGLSNRIYARHCEIARINIIDAVNFASESSLAQSPKFEHAIGLFYNQVLVMIAAIDHSKNIHVCSALDTAVVGGVTKVLSFVQQTQPCNDLTIQCNLLTHTGSSLEMIKFPVDSITAPTCSYTDGNKIVESSSTLSSLRRFWNCGFKTFKITKHEHT